jgi:hypothetical protein
LKTLEKMLRTKVKVKGLNGDVEITPNFRVAVQSATNSRVHFIIHPLNHNGDTLDFLVQGNDLICVSNRPQDPPANPSDQKG